MVFHKCGGRVLFTSPKARFAGGHTGYCAAHREMATPCCSLFALYYYGRALLSVVFNNNTEHHLQPSHEGLP